MEADCVSRREHEEFARRMEDENHRQNRRLEVLEENVRQIGELTVSVERLACSMENMAQEVHRQAECLDNIEKEPAAKWQGMKKKAIETAVTVIVTALVIGAVMLIAQYIR